MINWFKYKSSKAEDTSILINDSNMDETDFNKLQTFWTKYGHLYPEDFRKCAVKGLANTYIDSKCFNSIPYAGFSEIFVHCGIMPPKVNYYQYFLDYLTENFSNFYDKKVLEVACGYYPAFAELVAKEMTNRESLGNIDAMDPLLIVDELNQNKLQLSKEAFDLKTDISNADMLVSMFPCEVTKPLIDKILEEEKELAIIPCNCLHEIDNQQFKYYHEYIIYLMNLLKNAKSSRYECDTEYLKAYNLFHPVLYLRKK